VVIRVEFDQRAPDFTYNGMSADPLTLGITSDVGAVANFLTECAKVGLSIEELFNSPQMIQARLNIQEQAAKDKIAKDEAEALKTGVSTEIDKDLS
jgi:hypothetical protein